MRERLHFGWWLVGGLLGAEIAGADTRTEQVRLLESWVADREMMVASWERDATIIFALGLATLVLGIATAALQGVKRAKAISVVLGIAISLASGVRTYAYQNDHHAFRRAKAEAKAHLEAARLKLTSARSIPDDSWPAFAEELRRDLDRVDRLAASLESGERLAAATALAPATEAERSWLAAPAWASKGGRPDWVARPPAPTASSLYLTAEGRGRSLQEARQAALQDSREMLERWVITELFGEGMAAEDRQALVESTLAASEEAGTYFAHEAESGLFHYFRLVRVDRKDLESRVRFAAISEQRKQPEKQIQVIAKSAPRADQLASPRATTDLLLGQMQRELSAELWQKFSDGRYRRLKGDLQGATELLREVVAAAPDSYLAWFNLALALDDQGRSGEAEAAYRRALALEPTLPARDPAIYNTLGYHLYRQGRAQQAVPLLERALAIDPAHAKAKLNLQAAKRSAS